MLGVVQGDPFSPRDLGRTKEAGDQLPTQLIAGITSLNQGLDFRASQLRAATDFCIGATVDLDRALEVVDWVDREGLAPDPDIQDRALVKVYHEDSEVQVSPMKRQFFHRSLGLCSDNQYQSLQSTPILQNWDNWFVADSLYQSLVLPYI